MLGGGSARTTSVTSCRHLTSSFTASLLGCRARSLPRSGTLPSGGPQSAVRRMLRLPGTGSNRHRPKSSVCLVERTDGSVVTVEVLAATRARHRARAAPPRSGITEQTTVEDFGRTLLVTSRGSHLIDEGWLDVGTRADAATEPS